ncbi:C2 calcium-dependent domain-containing protein 4C isoform X2 [Hippoglossus stenolepis]|nr:C2 calcium-dependent domain-containing protein 4C isoform X2 [Hippoglossus stenolepis]XP_035038244.1 C2 calcium-dependent domain-containing protein 4C isoform X2 [Hippoglossus stenolepis]
MSVIKSGSSLRTLVLTPERLPAFLIPSRSPRLILSLHRSSPDWVRLLSDHDEDSAGASPPEVPPSPAASPRFLLRLPPRLRIPRRSAAAAAESADMPLPHVEDVTTPYGFRAVLAESPRTHRRESLFHRNKPVTVTVTDPEQLPVEGPGPGPSPGRSRACVRTVKSLGLQVMKQLKILSPAARRSQRSQDQ